MKKFISLTLLTLSFANAQAVVVTPSDGAYLDYFGYSIALSGNSAIVGSFNSDIGTNLNAGAVYLYDITNGTQIKKITASDPASQKYFGMSVSTYGNIGISGAYRANSTSITNTGAAYIFDISTGLQKKKLTASDAAQEAGFGYSVANNANYILVGANQAKYASKSNVGSVYVFNASTQTQTTKLVASDAAENSYFGNSIALDNNTAVIGAYRSIVNTKENAGAAYVFNLSTNKQVVKLKAADAAANNYFGNSVSVSGTTAIVGAFNANIGAKTNAGAAYLFNTTTGVQTAKLVASDATAAAGFGMSVAISGNIAAVGAYQAYFQSISNAGAAYFFNASTGAQTLKISASDSATNTRFGSYVTMNGNTFAVGAIAGYSGTIQTGKVYISDYRAFTKLDDGNTTVSTGGLSAISSGDLIVGDTTSANKIILSSKDSANFTVSGKKIYIGKSAGSNNNIFQVAGTLAATDIEVGALDNSENTIYIMKLANIDGVGFINLNSNNSLAFEGLTLKEQLFDYLGDVVLKVNGNVVGTDNYDDLLTFATTPLGGQFTAVPEPSTFAALICLAALATAFARRGKRR